MESNKKIISFVLIMCFIVAVVLAFMIQVTGPLAKKNEEIFNKRAILKAIETKLGDKKVADYGDDEILALFADKVEHQVVRVDGSLVDGVKAEEVDMAKEKKKPEAERNLPVFMYNGAAGKNYIVSIRGNGLWDEIWGYVALESDLNTIAGTAFDDKGETPGLGAEIKDNASFPARFIGEKIYDEAGKYVSVKVQKGGANPDDIHAVDGISGATVTADGVSEMMNRGLGYYTAYFASIKK